MTQQEFYNLPEVKKQLDIQRNNPHGSEAHRAAFDAIGPIADKHGVGEEYRKAGGGQDY